MVIGPPATKVAFSREAKHVCISSPVKDMLFCPVIVIFTSPPTGRQTVCGSTLTLYFAASAGAKLGKGLSQSPVLRLATVAFVIFASVVDGAATPDGEGDLSLTSAPEAGFPAAGTPTNMQKIMKSDAKRFRATLDTLTGSASASLS